MSSRGYGIRLALVVTPPPIQRPPFSDPHMLLFCGTRPMCSSSPSALCKGFPVVLQAAYCTTVHDTSGLVEPCPNNKQCFPRPSAHPSCACTYRPPAAARACWLLLRLPVRSHMYASLHKAVITTAQGSVVSTVTPLLERNVCHTVCKLPAHHLPCTPESHAWWDSGVQEMRGPLVVPPWLAPHLYWWRSQQPCLGRWLQHAWQRSHATGGSGSTAQYRTALSPPTKGIRGRHHS